MSISVDSDDLIAVAIAGGKTWKEAAVAASVSISTVTRRMSDPAFRIRIREIQRQVIDRATGLLAEALADAVARLHLIVNNAQRDGDAIKAAVAILDFAKQYITDADLIEEVRQLEQRLERLGTGGPPQNPDLHPLPAIPPGADPVSG